uniref:heavy metal translocating P-type ATPase n=1 Tax=Roseburia inulinivorans TaxID=360807 RepID=UPI004038BD22
MKERFDVTGMTCSACSSHVEKSVGKLTGVENVSVNLLTNSMQVEFDENKLDTAGIIKAVEDAGYGAAVKDGHAKSGTKTSGQSDSQENSGLSAVEQNVKNMKKRLIVSLIFWIPLMYVSMGHMIYQWLNIPMPPFTMNFLHGNENAITYAFTQFLLLLPILIANQKYFKNGFKTLWHRSPNMDSLIAIGAGAAILYGIFAIYRIGYAMGHGDMAVVHQYAHDLYFESAGTILTLITIGKYLETKSKGKTSEAITKLLNLAPKTVTVVRDGVEQTVDAADVEKGEIFLVKPGESVAVDGIVLEGKSSFDESAITGESIPVPKQEGDTIVSASMNKSGLIRAKATKVGEDTTIAQIIRLVEEASSSKAPIAKMADKIAGVFVPAVITIALITGVIWLISGATFEFAMSTAIAVLVISCPCALGLATPVAIMVGTGKGAENGILIKSGDALETAHQIDTVVLDKTGTITQGKPVVTDIICAAGKNADKTQLLQIAGSLEKGSEHPLAEAIVNYCVTNNISLEKVTDFNALFGKGIEGTVSGTHYFAGNEKMMEEKGISLSTEQKNQIQALAKQGRTPLLFADEKQFLGIVAVADVVKPTSKEAVQKFRDYGIHVIMLTGDNEVTAQAIKEQVGIDEVIAGVLPTQKEEKISALKQAGHKVAMIGDGVNDAPALASADVGIAIGAGTDVAIESADIVLMKNDLLDAVGAVKLSKAVIRNIKENLFWAFFYNSIGIPLAAGVLYPFFQIKLNPMFGAAAMSLSSVCVVSNALRLRWVKLHDAKKTQSEPYQDVAASTIADINQHNALDNNIKSTNNDKGESTMTTTISIEGMMCAHCQAHVEKALKEVAGVTEVTVSLENKNAVVTGDASVEALKQAVVDAGYEVTDVK